MAALHITEENFEKEVLQSKQPVLVDFWAEWCGPCQMLAPVLEEVSNEVSQGKIAKVNVEECSRLAEQYKIMNIPTLILFKNGVEQERVIGRAGKENILQLFEK